MKKQSLGRNIERILVISFVVAFICSCATAPTAQQGRDIPLRDFRELAGKWEGTLCISKLGCSPSVLTFMEDGSGEIIVPRDSVLYAYTTNGVWPIARKLVDGKIHITNKVNGATGLATVREVDGKRVMVYRSDDNTTTGEYKLVPK